MATTTTTLLGHRLLDFLYQWAAIQYAPLRDITVEDPSPSFVALRDAVDLTFVLDICTDDTQVRASLEARHIAEPQIDRVLTILQWGRAVKSGSKEEQDRIRLAVVSVGCVLCVLCVSYHFFKEKETLQGECCRHSRWGGWRRIGRAKGNPGTALAR